MSDILRKTNGIRGLYKGSLASILVAFQFRSFYHGLYDSYRHLLGKKPGLLYHYLFAQAVTNTGSFIAYPLHTVSRRQMMTGTDSNPMYRGLVHTIRTIL